MARKRALNSATPFINLRFIVMEQNEHEIPQLMDLARSLGVDALTLKTLCTYYRDTDPMARVYTELLPKDFRFQRFTYSRSGRDRLRTSQNLCKRLWINPSIHWNSTICSCFFDPREENVLGSLKRDIFKTIWWGPAYRHYAPTISYRLAKAFLPRLYLRVRPRKYQPVPGNHS